MKVCKVYVTRQDSREEKRREYSSRIFREVARSNGSTRDAKVQYNYKKDNLLCTCRKVTGVRRLQEVRYLSGFPKHIYTYQPTSFIDIGVGSVKAFLRRKVKRIYLPETEERGVGSSSLFSICNRRTWHNKGANVYEQKKTSSKCVGGMIETGATVISKKLSPIVHKKSGGTSPRISVSIELKKNVEENIREKELVTTSTQASGADNEDVKIEVRAVEIKIEQEKEAPTPVAKKSVEVLTTPVKENENPVSKRAQEAERVFSSDSLVQHVYNLETPSEEQSPVPIDPMENKLEREYRKIFSTKSKDVKENDDVKVESSLKSTSILRRRFEALRRGISKKEDSKRSAVITNESSNGSQRSRKDVSIVSDPPSLEGRSYSSTKINSSYSKTSNSKMTSNSKDYKKPYQRKKDWDHGECEESDSQGVKAMFKLWGKKFNLDDDHMTSSNAPEMFETPPKVSIDAPKQKEKMAGDDSSHKKEGKKFFFFKRKSKDKPKQPYKQKKGLTAGRCEVGDGLTIKIGTGNPSTHPNDNVKNKVHRNVEQIPEDYGEMLRKAWLQRFLSRATESRNSVKIRWNNNAYATSSSTIFEIMENVYKDTGVIFRSRSDVTVTGESSYYKSFTKQRVNFAQDVEAWMIPKFIPDNNIELLPAILKMEDRKKNLKVRISNQKWFIDKSKAFAHKIEVVLHSRNFLKCPNNSSSEYLTIDIPRGFFSETSSDSGAPIHTSNEEVYKIVEYETPESQSRFRASKVTETGDYLKVTVSAKDSCNIESKILETVVKNPLRRDVVIQGSDVCVPKRCNVIGVGIITQKDLNRIRKPILKIKDEYSEDSGGSLEMVRVKSKFADSYLQDYYRHWIPFSMDSSWCVSDSHIEGPETARVNMHNQGDVSKSCPNIFDDYQASMISSCGTSCCTPCSPLPWEDDKPGIVGKFCKKFKPKAKSEPNYLGIERRVLPKDSVEVFRKRKIYAQSNKSNWLTTTDRPYSVPSLESCGAPDTLIDCPRPRTTFCKGPEKKQKSCNKHVSLPDCDTLTDSLLKQLDSPTHSGILTFKGSNIKCNSNENSTCLKHARVISKPTCTIEAPRHPCHEMMPPPCRSSSPCSSCAQVIDVLPPCGPPISITVSEKPSILSPQQYVKLSPPRSYCSNCNKISPTPSHLIHCPPESPITTKNCRRKKPKSSQTCKKPAKKLCTHAAGSPSSSGSPCSKGSPGRPPCGSPPVRSGIHLRSPPRSECMVKPIKQNSCVVSPTSSSESLCVNEPKIVPVKQPVFVRKSPLCTSISPHSTARKTPICPSFSPPKKTKSSRKKFPPCPSRTRSPCPPRPVSPCPSNPCCPKAMPCGHKPPLAYPPKPQCGSKPLPPCPNMPPPCPPKPMSPCPSKSVTTCHPPKKKKSCSMTSSATQPCPPSKEPCKSCCKSPGAETSMSSRSLSQLLSCLNKISETVKSVTRTKSPKSSCSKCCAGPHSAPTSPKQKCSPPESPPKCTHVCSKCSRQPATIKTPRPSRVPKCSNCLKCSSSSSVVDFPPESPKRACPPPQPTCKRGHRIMDSSPGVSPTDSVISCKKPRTVCPKAIAKRCPHFTPPAPIEDRDWCQSPYVSPQPSPEKRVPYKPPKAPKLPPECSPGGTPCPDSISMEGVKISTPDRIERPSCKACRKTKDTEPQPAFPWPLENKNSDQSFKPIENPDEPQEPPQPKKPDPVPAIGAKKPVPTPAPEPCPNKTGRCPGIKTNSAPRKSGIYLKMKNRTNDGQSTKPEPPCLPKPVKPELSEPGCPTIPCPNRPNALLKKTSDDSIIINIKKGTASTEEIREGFSVKVQDADGNTLYERKDYVNTDKTPGQQRRPSLLNDMYKNSQVHTACTSLTNNEIEVLNDESNTDGETRSETRSEARSDDSVANLIEINFKLKVTQGDKTSDINFVNNKCDTKNQIGQTSQEVFMLKDEAEQCYEDLGEKNDINIKIVIKKFKPKKEKAETQCCADFAHNISQQFQTVSTGYSDNLPRRFAEKSADNTVFSIHRASVKESNLSVSYITSKNEIVEKSHTRRGENASEERIEHDPIDLIVTSQGGTEKATDKSESKFNVDKSISKPNTLKDIYKEVTACHDNIANYSSISNTDAEQNFISDEPHLESLENMAKPLSKAQKKSLLKKVMEKAAKIKKHGNKDKMKKIKDMLRVILADSKDRITVPSKELINEMPYSSCLTTSFWRDTDSMNNFYRVDSSVTPSKQDSDEEFNHPTENESDFDGQFTDASEDDKFNTCLCNTLAEKLNLCKEGVCCCASKQRGNNKETCCDMRTEEDFFLLNYKAIEYANVETQSSKYGQNIKVSMQSTSCRNCFDVEALKRNEIEKINIFKKDKGHSPHKKHSKHHCELKKFNRNTVLGISDEDKVYVRNTELKVSGVFDKRSIDNIIPNKAYVNHRTSADILQSYEAKKAVLELYAEKTVALNGERIVAKLPKFHNDENDIENERYARTVRDVRKNVVMISVKR